MLSAWMKNPFWQTNPAVRRARFGAMAAMGIHILYFSWGAIWSYQEFPNH